MWFLFSCLENSLYAFKVCLHCQSVIKRLKCRWEVAPNSGKKDQQGALQLCAILYFKRLQTKSSGTGGWHKAQTNIFIMQTSEPQITYFIIWFLQVLLAPKGQLLTAQFSPLTLIKVFLGSWSWWTWRTLILLFFLICFSHQVECSLWTLKLMNFPVHFTRYFCLHVWLKMEAFHKSPSRNHFISQFVHCILENMGLFVKKFTAKKFMAVI